VNVNDALEQDERLSGPLERNAEAGAPAGPEAAPPATSANEVAGDASTGTNASTAAAEDGCSRPTDSAPADGHRVVPDRRHGAEALQESARAERPGGSTPLAGAAVTSQGNSAGNAFGRRFQGATIQLDIELRTPIVRQVFRRDFFYVSRQLHALDASRRVQGLDRTLLNNALCMVHQRAEAVRFQLLQSTAQMQALILLHGRQAVEIEFARPTSHLATIVSPAARIYLDTLAVADDALTQIEIAWLLGLLDADDKTTLVSDCRKALKGYKEVVRQQRRVIGVHVREVNDAIRAEKAVGSGAPTSSQAVGQLAGSTNLGASADPDDPRA
jgi:hypothetical protein